MSELSDGYVMDADYEEEDDVEDTEEGTIEVSKLAPTEIADYVIVLRIWLNIGTIHFFLH